MTEPLLLSIRVALLATLVAGVLGVLLAGFLSMARLPGRELIDALLTAPLVLPPTVLGYYLLTTLGRRSPVGRFFEEITGEPLVFGPTALLIAATVAALPLIVRATRAAMDEVDPVLLGVAKTLGATPPRVFFTVLVPLSRRGIVAGLSLGFARALGDFGVTLMLAGNIPGVTRTAPLAIYDAVQAGRDTEAAGLALCLASFAVLCLSFSARLTSRRVHGF